jgi:hypothetical protein
MKSRLVPSACLFALLALTACSNSSGSGSGAGGIPSDFSKYCTGTLKTSVPLMKADGPGAWLGDGQQASPGTVFVLSYQFDSVGGYVFQSDGSPEQLQTGLGQSFVEGTNFASSCAPTGSGFVPTTTVLLAPATLYPNQDLSGTACTLAAGTTLTNFSFSLSVDTAAQVSANEITAQCGVATMYSPDIEDASLLSGS